MSLLLLDGLKPFSLLAGFIVVLLLAELALMLVGLSSTAGSDGAQGPASDIGADAPDAIDHGQVLGEDELALLDLPPVTGKAMAAPPSLPSQVLRATGYGRTPLLVWLTCLATGLSAFG